MPNPYPQYGPGFPQSGAAMSPALDALRRLMPGNASPGSGDRPNPFGDVDTTPYGTPTTSVTADNSTRPGWGGQLSPPPSNPPSGTPPVEQSGNAGVMASLRQAFPPRQFEGPKRLQLEQ